MDIRAFKELSFPRKLTYDVLSELFSKRPDETFLRKLCTGGLMAFLGKSCECEEITGKLELTLKGLLYDNAKITKLCGEFEQVFLIPVADTYVPPMASAFMGPDTKAALSGSLHEELTAIYGLYGAKFRNDKEDVFVFHPDHIASLFNFMAFLVEKENYNSKQDASYTFHAVVYGEERFFARFIQSWINGYLSEMRSKVSSDFYKQIAAFTQNYISNENRLLRAVRPEEMPRAAGR